MRPSVNINRLVIVGNDLGIFGCPCRSDVEKTQHKVFCQGGWEGPSGNERGDCSGQTSTNTAVGRVISGVNFKWGQ